MIGILIIGVVVLLVGVISGIQYIQGRPKMNQSETGSAKMIPIIFLICGWIITGVGLIML